MSMFTCKLFDGYQLNNADGYSCTSDWQDIHSSPFYSISVVFSGGTPSGTLTLEMSNDENVREKSSQFSGMGTNPNGLSFLAPVLKDFPVTGGSPQGNPLDYATISGSSQTVSSATTFVYNTETAGYRWVRLKYIATSGTCQIDAWMHRKAQK